MEKDLEKSAGAGLLDRYLLLLREHGIPESTVKRRAHLLYSMAEALGGEDGLLTAGEEEIRRAASARLTRKKEVLLNWHADAGAFFAFLIREGLRGDNPLEYSPAFASGGMKKRRRDRRTLPASEINRLRDDAILALLRETDILPEELERLSVGCYDRELARLTPGPGRLVPLNVFAAELLEDYLDALRGRMKPADASPMFIDAMNGRPLPENHCWTLIRRDLRLAT